MSSLGTHKTLFDVTAASQYLAHYPCWEGSGSSIGDYSGNSNSAVVGSSVVAPWANDNYVSSEAIADGEAINIPTSTIDLSDYASGTVVILYRMITALTATVNSGNYQAAATQSGFFLQSLTNGRLRLDVSDGAGNSDNTTFVTPNDGDILVADTEASIGIVIDQSANLGAIYVNGKVKVTDTMPLAVSFSGALSFQFGDQGDSGGAAVAQFRDVHILGFSGPQPTNMAEMVRRYHYRPYRKFEASEIDV